jgi:hypothetical protein
MSTKNDSSRRQFLLKTIVAGSILGLGCPKLIASGNTLSVYKESSDEAVVETLRFILTNNIGIYKGLEKELGSEKLIKMLQQITADNWAEGIKEMTKDIKERNIENYAKLAASIMSSTPYSTALKYEITQQDDKVLEIKYTKCLFAEIFREMNAADIGWALECSAGETVIKNYNPNMKLSNPNNLMKGDSSCIERIELKA